MFLRKIEVRAIPEGAENRFPFSIPAIKALPSLLITSPVTFLVGENGTGKSTLLEALAISIGLPTVGSAEVGEDNTLQAQRELADWMKLHWKLKTRRGFFLRAEDFFGFVKRLAKTRQQLTAELREVEEEFAARSDYARKLARGPLLGSKAEIESRYGPSLDSHSHGESFLKLFQTRFVPDGLYLLDEPETPLSPQNQLTFISILHQMVSQGGQFIIATHSPILLAYPAASILSLDHTPPKEIAYDDVEQVYLTRSFLNNPDRFLRQLLD